MYSRHKRLIVTTVTALLLAAPAILLLFICIVGPNAGLRHLHRTLAAAEARALLRRPAALRVIAPHATAAERAVWNELLLGYSTAQHPVAVSPQSTWDEASEDAAELFDRIVEGSPNTPGEPLAAWAVNEFLVRNSQAERIPVERFALRIVPVERASFCAAVDRRPGWERVAERIGSARAYVSLSRVGFSANGRFALVYVEVYCGSLCGYGSYHVLRLEDGRWRTIAEHTNWVS